MGEQNAGAGDDRNEISHSGRKRNGPALLVRMDPELHRLLKHHAENHDRQMSQVVRRAIKEYLQRQDDYVAPY